MKQWLGEPQIADEKNLIGMGDFNIDTLSNNFYGTPEYLNIINTNAIVNHILKPTRLEFKGGT